MKTVLFDFDGTVTNVWRIGRAFFDIYLMKAADRLHMLPAMLEKLMFGNLDEITRNPGLYGWLVNGVIVASATSDPFLYYQAAMRMCLKHMQNVFPHSIFVPKEDKVEAFMTEIYQASYKLVSPPFRADAAWALKTIMAKNRLVVVTNSSTSSVAARLAELLGPDAANVELFGNAMKFIPDVDGQTMKVPGLERPIYIYRPKYVEVLEKIGQVDIVFGDIAELDIWPLQHLYPNAKAVLISSPQTPDWEMRYLRGSDHLVGDDYQVLLNELKLV